MDILKFKRDQYDAKNNNMNYFLLMVFLVGFIVDEGRDSVVYIFRGFNFIFKRRQFPKK